MKFWEAMKAVEEGKKVKRKEWVIYAGLLGWRVYMFDYIENDYYPSIELQEYLASSDLTANDWEIVDSESDDTLEFNASQVAPTDEEWDDLIEETEYLEEDE